MGTSGHMLGAWASNVWLILPCRRRVVTIVPESTNRSQTSTAWSRNPPGLSRRSRISPRIWWSASHWRASRISSAVFSAKLVMRT